MNTVYYPFLGELPAKDEFPVKEIQLTTKVYSFKKLHNRIPKELTHPIITQNDFKELLVLQESFPFPLRAYHLALEMIYDYAKQDFFNYYEDVLLHRISEMEQEIEQLLPKETNTRMSLQKLPLLGPNKEHILKERKAEHQQLRDIYSTSFIEEMKKTVWWKKDYTHTSYLNTANSFHSIALLCAYAFGSYTEPTLKVILPRLFKELVRRRKEEIEAEGRRVTSYSAKADFLQLFSNYMGHVYPLRYLSVSKIDPWLNQEKNAHFFQKYAYLDREHTFSAVYGFNLESDFPTSGLWRQYMDYFYRKRAETIKEVVIERLKEANFSWEGRQKELSLEPLFTYNDIEIHFLHPEDEMALILDDLTVCCQGLNKAGESCMFEGLVNPQSGFLVFKRAGRVLAQSWIWEPLLSKDESPEKKTLVLDNIEYANHIYPEHLNDALKAYCEIIPYETIHLGLGYTQGKYRAEHVEEKDITWFKPLWEEDYYTDAKRRIYLKKEEKVCFELIQSKEA